jgi:hypothetical protein
MRLTGPNLVHFRIPLQDGSSFEHRVSPLFERTGVRLTDPLDISQVPRSPVLG